MGNRLVVASVVTRELIPKRSIGIVEGCIVDTLSSSIAMVEMMFGVLELTPVKGSTRRVT